MWLKPFKEKHQEILILFINVNVRHCSDKHLITWSHLLNGGDSGLFESVFNKAEDYS